MKTGLGIYQKIRLLYAYYNLFRFTIRNKLLGFDVANQFVQRVDKKSIQLILRKNGATIGEDCDIETGLIFHNCSNYSNLIIGDNCHIGKNCFFDLRNRLLIANNVVISMQCTFLTHIDMSKSQLKTIFPSKAEPINIGDNAYLGARATVLKNITIGQNVIVAAGSVINKSVEDGIIVGGIPAKFIKIVK